MTRAKSKADDPAPDTAAETETGDVSSVVVPNVGPDAVSGGGEPLNGGGFEQVETTQESAEE